MRIKTRARSEVTTFIFAPWSEQQANPFQSELVELIHCPKDSQFSRCAFLTSEADAFQHAI